MQSRLKLIKLILVGTLIRIILMPFVAHPFDIWCWYKYCNNILNNGFSLSMVSNSIRPLWPLTLVPVAYLYGFLSFITGLKAIPVKNIPPQMNPQWGIQQVPGPLFNTLVKIPMLISDIAISVVLYKMISKHYEVDMGEKAAMLFYLNPAVIWISSAWGQYDTIPALFTILSLYLILEKKFISSSLSLLIATLYKVYPIALLIPASIYLFKKESKRNLITYLSVFLIPIFISLFLKWDLLLRFISGFFSYKTFHGIFGFGLTYWSISMLYPLNPVIFNLFSIGIMIILLIASFYLIAKAKFNDKIRDLTLSAILIAASIFLSYRYPMEQRIVWLIPFLAIAVSKNYITEKIFWALSAVAFLYMQKTFPYYLLPIATLNQKLITLLFQSTSQFRNVVQGTLMPTSISAIILATLGIIFSILMIKIYLKSIVIIRLNKKI